MNFEILKKMEPFTVDMFNNIIDFQERTHPAWNASLPFDERIENLPLHYLIFSNADRNPVTHGPTVAHYYPLCQENKIIAHYARQVAETPRVLDVHARNGFVGSLLAREGLNVVGLRDSKEKPNQIESFLDADHYELRIGTLHEYDAPVDVIFSSWMPAGTDITNDVVRLNPKLVVYFYTEHLNEQTNEPQTGTLDAFGDTLPEHYYLLDEWEILRRKDLLNGIWPDLTGNIEETRKVRIFAQKAYPLEQVEISVHSKDKYAWERELEMAETAFEAKERLIHQGFPVDSFR